MISGVPEMHEQPVPGVTSPHVTMNPILPLAIAVSLQAADFPTPYNSEKSTEPLMPAEEAARGMAMPDGFKCTVFASEPDVQNPIAMAWDAKGRMWIAENYTYAEQPKRF